MEQIAGLWLSLWVLCPLCLFLGVCGWFLDRL